MANYWLLKTEPSTYSYRDLERERRTTWDGVNNPVALRNMRSMERGDQAFVYHTGDEKAIVGIARVSKGAYPDPKGDDPKLVVVDLEPIRAVQTPVPLAQVKADSRFADFALTRIPRLSVMPVTPAQWKSLLTMAGEKG
jgi:predicted RNA-binding protein with PUA-like domain